MTATIAVQPQAAEKTSKSHKGIYIFLAIVGVLVILWILVRPGVFTVQSIGALPKGVTILYYGRNSEMPLFSSPDGLCLQIQGNVSLICRMAALNSASELMDRIIFRLPYSHWAYLRSTGGLEFDQ